MALRKPGLSIPGFEHVLPSADHPIQGVEMAIQMAPAAFPNARPAIPKCGNAIPVQKAGCVFREVLLSRPRYEAGDRFNAFGWVAGSWIRFAIGSDVQGCCGATAPFRITSGAQNGGQIAGTSVRSGLLCVQVETNHPDASQFTMIRFMATNRRFRSPRIRCRTRRPRFRKRRRLFLASADRSIVLSKADER